MMWLLLIFGVLLVTAIVAVVAVLVINAGKQRPAMPPQGNMPPYDPRLFGPPGPGFPPQQAGGFPQRFCQRCGSGLPGDFAFCPFCGTPLMPGPPQGPTGQQQ